MRVVHCKREPFDVYIGRPSKWGNPFELGPDGDRDLVVKKYRDWILTQPQLLADLPELYGKALGCYCAPRACHGDVLLELAKAAQLREIALAHGFAGNLKELVEAGLIPGARAIRAITIKATGERFGEPRDPRERLIVPRGAVEHERHDQLVLERERQKEEAKKLKEKQRAPKKPLRDQAS